MTSLTPDQVIVVGYWPVPDQSAPRQLRDQFGNEAMVAIEAIADQFEQRGGQTEPVVVFTHERSTSVDSVTVDYEVMPCSPPVGDTFDRVLVSLRGDDNLEQIRGFVGTLLHESDAAVTMFSVAESDDASRDEYLYEGPRPTGRRVGDYADSQRLVPRACQFSNGRNYWGWSGSRFGHCG